MSQSHHHGRPDGSRAHQSRRSPQQIFSLVAAAVVIVLLLILAWMTDLPFYWMWLVALSVITWALYGFDKAQAKRGGLRVPEIVLHGLALLGGFAGGWIGRWMFHHKTRKRSFTVVLAASTLLHAGIIIYRFLL
jgi:uncharacterized membrane protein YsdA (DUF1294 family)